MDFKKRLKNAIKTFNKLQRNYHKDEIFNPKLIHIFQPASDL